MSLTNAKMNTNPIYTPQTIRRQTARGITSIDAGKMVPIAAYPLLREESIVSGRVRFNFEMMETAEMLMNAINVRVMAYLVPTLAFERFSGSMDQLNRSYSGESFKGLPVVPYIETHPMGAHGSNAVYKSIGLHARPDQQVNTAYLEAYNCIWNFRAKNRSGDLQLRERLDPTLAPAFWQHERFKHIVPDFDQAIIDGEVRLNVPEGRLPVVFDKKPANPGFRMVNSTDGKPVTGPSKPMGVDNLGFVYKDGGPGAVSFDPNGHLWAEMREMGITVSLSNIELARKTQAFAKLREQYHGHDDEYIINLLMDGITIPEKAFTQPILIGERNTVFGMAKRFASDGANLTQSVVNGATFVDMSLQLPRIPTGGVIMVVVEITPDQIFERQRDPYFHMQSTDQFPQYLRDTLDPEKVSVVPNEYVDVDHNKPNATFGYGPLNYEWMRDAPLVGGKFYRPKVDAGFNEDRQRIWASETKNPTLSENFYICTDIHKKPFVVTNKDPFEVTSTGEMLIRGNTVFGPALHEATNDYDKVLAKAPMDRIVKEQK